MLCNKAWEQLSFGFTRFRGNNLVEFASKVGFEVLGLSS
jgi:hypothetical protein